MNTNTWRAGARRAVAVALAAVLGASMLSATAATADVVEDAPGGEGVAGAWTVTEGAADWGIKESFRDYLGSSFAAGSIDVAPPAQQLDDGSFRFAAGGGSVTATTADLALDGQVAFEAHDGALEVRIAGLRVVIDGTEGRLLADLESRAQTPGAELVSYPGITLGDIDLEDAPLTVGDGLATVDGAAVVMTAEGATAFAGFYPEGTELDPLSFQVRLDPVEPAEPPADPGAGDDDVPDDSQTPGDPGGPGDSDNPEAPGDGDDPDTPGDGDGPGAPDAPGDSDDSELPSWEPSIEVFTADGVTPLGDVEARYGDTVVVKGTGFDPAANVGGRGAPIPRTLPQGTYVVFGSFAEDWRPSEGAAGSARTVGSQGWALSADVLAEVPEPFQDAIRAQWVELADDGTFTAELALTRPVSDGVEQEWPEGGHLGIYTYGAGGVDNADQELAVPIEVLDEPAPSWEPAIEVFAADGLTPLDDTEVTHGDTVVVKGTGFDPAANVGGRGVPIPSTLPQGTYVVFGSFAEEWRPSQGAPSSARVVGDQAWALAADVLEQVPPQFQDAIRRQWVEITADGSFTVELTVGGVGEEWPQDGTFGIYTYGAGGVHNADQELGVPVRFVDQPRISVYGPDGVTPAAGSQLTYGDTLVVKGTGFDPAANIGSERPPIQGELPQGTYVVFGKFAEEWRPSQGAASSARTVGSQAWALAPDVLEEIPPRYQDAIRAQWVSLEEDGSFTAELEVRRPVRDGVEQGWPAEGSFGVYTYAAGGATNADQELRVPLDVVEERAPRMQVEPTENLTVGSVVTVRGTGYAPDRDLSIAFTPAADTHEEFGWPVGWLQHEVVTTDALGSFTREITIHGWVTGTGEDCSQVECFLASFNSAQTPDVAAEDRRAERDQDVFVPVTFVAGEPEPEPGTPVVSAEPNPAHQDEHVTVTGRDLTPGTVVSASLEPDTVPAGGHLDWGVKEAFRSYVTGPIGGGEVVLGAGATQNVDGSFRFPAVLASSDGAVLSFAGDVSFRAHEIDGVHALDLTLANLRVQLTQDAAVLVADATFREFAGTDDVGTTGETQEVTLATVDRDALDVTAGQVTASGAAVALTAAGAPAFGDLYAAGTALDPVDLAVTYGGAVAELRLSAAQHVHIGTGEVGAEGAFTAGWQVPADFPIGGYAVVLRDADGTVLASTSLTVLAGVMPVDPPTDPPAEPEEPARGTVLVDPDPVVQGATATVRGEGLIPGTRVGAVIDAGGAPGTLEWGVKDSFRTYIVGPMAQGEITPVAPATVTRAGTYVFSEGVADGDAQDARADFAGAVSFRGHEIRGTHALEVTILDPSVVIEGGVGHLVADVHSREFIDTSSTGTITEASDVRLATLDLAGGAVEVAGGRLVGTDVPAVLTDAGVSAFADFYEAGDALDPVTFSVPLGDVEADLSVLDIAEATVAEDGTVELGWPVPADFTLGEHRVDLVTDGESVADTTVTVIAAAGGDDGSAGGSGTSAGSAPLPQTGADVAALTALAAAVILTGAVLTTRRQRA